MIPISADERAYLLRIKTFPMLSASDELAYARAYRESKNPKDLERLIKPHLRLVRNWALKFRPQNFPLMELIAEGNVALVKALGRFDPERGVRVSTYVQWSIRSAMQEYLLNFHSIVEMGTTVEVKKLFFNLGAKKSQLGLYDQNKDLSDAEVTALASALKVSDKSVREMNSRLRHEDSSFDNPLSAGETDSKEFRAIAKHQDPHAEQRALEIEDKKLRSTTLLAAFEEAHLKPRELFIIAKRRLMTDPPSLDTLAEELGLSREMVRRIETRAFTRLQAATLEITKRQETDPSYSPKTEHSSIAQLITPAVMDEVRLKARENQLARENQDRVPAAKRNPPQTTKKKLELVS